MAENNLINKLEDFLTDFKRGLAKINRLNDNQYNISVIGVGDLGYHIACSLATHNDYIHKLIISNRTDNNANVELLDNVMHQINLDVGDYSQTKQWLFDEEIDISVISVGEFDDDREKEIDKNFPIITNLAEHFQGYSGSTVVATNATDIMAYVFASVSQVDPYSVTGFNHVDVTRCQIDLYKILKKFLNSDSEYQNYLESFSKNCNAPLDLKLEVIGAHNSDCMLPYLIKTKIGMHNLTEIPNLLSRELYGQLKDSLTLYSKKLYTLSNQAKGNASDNAASAFSDDVLTALANQWNSVSMSVWRPERKLFAGWPTKFRDLIAVPQSLDFPGSHGDWLKSDFNWVCEDYIEKNLDRLRAKGWLTSEPAQVIQLSNGIEKKFKKRLEEFIQSSDNEFEILTSGIENHSDIYNRFAGRYEKIKDKLNTRIYNASGYEKEEKPIEITSEPIQKTSEQEIEDQLRNMDFLEDDGEIQQEDEEEELMDYLRKKPIMED